MTEKQAHPGLIILMIVGFLLCIGAIGILLKVCGFSKIFVEIIGVAFVISYAVYKIGYSISRKR